MQIPKDTIVSMIESRLGGDQAQQAAQQLPDQVDHEQHAGLLSQFGVNPQELLSQFGGAQSQGGGFDQSQSQGGGFDQEQGSGSDQDPSQGGIDQGQEQGSGDRSDQSF